MLFVRRNAKCCLFRIERSRLLWSGINAQNNARGYIWSLYLKCKSDVIIRNKACENERNTSKRSRSITALGYTYKYRCISPDPEYFCLNESLRDGTHNELRSNVKLERCFQIVRRVLHNLFIFHLININWWYRLFGPACFFVNNLIRESSMRERFSKWVLYFKKVACHVFFIPNHRSGRIKNIKARNKNELAYSVST